MINQINFGILPKGFKKNVGTALLSGAIYAGEAVVFGFMVDRVLKNGGEGNIIDKVSKAAVTAAFEKGVAVGYKLLWQKLGNVPLNVENG